MRITNQNPLPASALDNSTDAAATTRNDSAPGASSSSSSTSSSVRGTLAPSFELLNLATTLQQIPQVRQEVIAETIRRLAAGELETPTALQQTARAIVGI